MKAGREHRVPLSPQALAVLDRAKPLRRSDDYIFPGKKKNRPLSDMAMLQLLERMGRRYEITVHGFRSTLRDWAAEQTSFPNEVAEMALAHAIEDKTEAAYRRGDLFEKRRALMIAWPELRVCAASTTFYYSSVRNGQKQFPQVTSA